jgi:hypothetical protein
MRRLGPPQSTGVAPSATAVAPAPWKRPKGLQAAPPPQVAPGGRRKRGDAGCAAPTGHLFQTPRSVRGLLVGPRRPAPRPRARRGESVLCHHHHRVRRHHNHHHHRSRRHHYHLGVIFPGAPAAAATTAAIAAVAPLPGSLESSGPQVSVTPFFISLFIVPTGLNPSFACQGFLPFCSQGHASSARYHVRRVWLSAAGVCWEWRRRSAPGCCNCADGYRNLNDGDAVEYTVGSGGGGPNCAHPHHRG